MPELTQKLKTRFVCMNALPSFGIQHGVHLFTYYPLGLSQRNLLFALTYVRCSFAGKKFFPMDKPRVKFGCVCYYCMFSLSLILFNR